MQQVLIVFGYEVGALILIYGLIERVGSQKMVEVQFDWRYFLKLSVILAASIQIGFVILVSFLFHNQESVAVGLTALVGIPGFFLMLMGTQSGFFRRYKRLPNLIQRLEKMNSIEREKTLSELPPKIFSQLPGDYRFVSPSTNSNR